MTRLGIDIGGTRIKAAAIDADGRTLWQGASPPYTRPAATDLTKLLRDLLASAPTSTRTTIGLCAPGIFDPASGALTAAVNMPGLVGVPLNELITSALPSGLPAFAPIHVISDVHAAAHDFAVAHHLRHRLLAVSLGTGIGAVVLDDLTPLRITGLSSGHFGQMDVTVPGIDPVPLGPDGGRGGLEAYLGLPALRARHGDPAAWLAALTGHEPELHALARAIRIAHAIYRPDHIALLGGIGIRLRPILAQLRDHISRDLTSLARPGWTLTTGDDDHHAARGAARLAPAPSPR